MKLYLFIMAFLHLFAFVASGQGETIIDAGGAIDSLRQNNAVVGILYFIVLVQAGVIVKLWVKINQVSNERISDLKERLKSEEDLRKEIQEIYIKLNLEK